MRRSTPNAASVAYLTTCHENLTKLLLWNMVLATFIAYRKVNYFAKYIVELKAYIQIDRTLYIYYIFRLRKGVTLTTNAKGVLQLHHHKLKHVISQYDFYCVLHTTDWDRCTVTLTLNRHDSLEISLFLLQSTM